MAGCRHAQPSQGKTMHAGPFAVTVPVAWSRKASITKVPIQPLYSADDWKAYQNDARRVLKPAYECRPQHWALRFPGALPKSVPFSIETSGGDPTAPQILIHKADEWAVAFTDGVHEEKKPVDLLRGMRQSMDQATVRDDRHLSPAFMDAELSFMCLKRRIDFQGGHGVRLVAQWTIEPDLMRLGELHYLFLGMSDDNTCQIIATFPLTLPGLPSHEDKSHLGRSTADYAELSRSFSRYEADAKRWLQDHEGQIIPSLQTLDGVMQSLNATHWA